VHEIVRQPGHESDGTGREQVTDDGVPVEELIDTIKRASDLRRAYDKLAHGHASRRRHTTQPSTMDTH
jgi:hypothetical protein